MAPKEETKPKISYSILFTSQYRLRTLITSVIAATQSMEYFAVGFYLPVIFLWVIVGSLVFNCFGIVGGTWQAYVVGKFGSRKLAITGYIIAFVCLLTVGLFKTHLSIYMQALLIGMFIFGHSFGPGAQGMSMARFLTLHQSEDWVRVGAKQWFGQVASLVSISSRSF